MATIEDVAKRAGVSVSTVSYALSGKRPVSTATRQRILQIIQELDYHPHALASGLASRRSHIIGILYPTETSGLSESQIDLVLRITQSATERGYSVMLWSAPLRAEDVWKVICQHLLDGVILTEGRRMDPRVDLLRGKKYPFVLMGRCADSAAIDYVDVDFAEHMRLAVVHLAEFGHRSIAFLNASPDLMKLGINWILAAQEAFHQAASQYGLENFEVECKPTAAHAYEVMTALLQAHPSLTGLILMRDSLIPGVLKAVADLGLHIPDEFSIVTNFGARICEMASPTLTGFDDSSGEDIGSLAAHILIDRLEGKRKQPAHILLTPGLVQRQSSGPYRPISPA